jgi:hypothetical protein
METDMKHVENAELISAVPIQMTRHQKLLRWAELVRKSPHRLQMFNGLEYMTPRQLEAYPVIQCGVTALAVAASDPEFQAQGLRETSTIGETMRFFDLTLHEAHAFSCDCGGHIGNDEQARRIDSLAR